VFDTGNLWFVKQMVKEGCWTIRAHPALHGHRLRVPATPVICSHGQRAARERIGQLRHRAADALGGAIDLLGGNVRVGSRTTGYLSRASTRATRSWSRQAPHHHEAMGARIYRTQRPAPPEALLSPPA